MIRSTKTRLLARHGIEHISGYVTREQAEVIRKMIEQTDIKVQSIIAKAEDGKKS